MDKFVELHDHRTLVRHLVRRDSVEIIRCDEAKANDRGGETEFQCLITLVTHGGNSLTVGVHASSVKNAIFKVRQLICGRQEVDRFVDRIEILKEQNIRLLMENGALKREIRE